MTHELANQCAMLRIGRQMTLNFRAFSVRKLTIHIGGELGFDDFLLLSIAFLIGLDDRLP